MSNKHEDAFARMTKTLREKQEAMAKKDHDDKVRSKFFNEAHESIVRGMQDTAQRFAARLGGAVVVSDVKLGEMPGANEEGAPQKLRGLTFTVTSKLFPALEVKSKRWNQIEIGSKEFATVSLGTNGHLLLRKEKKAEPWSSDAFVALLEEWIKQ